jgi:methionine-S-sulfoxide reductase
MTRRHDVRSLPGARALGLVALTTLIAACTAPRAAASSAGEASEAASQPSSQPSATEGAQPAGGSDAAGGGQPLAAPVAPPLRAAVFAGGCFWCMEGPFEAVDGVVEVLSGYTGGTVPNPTYHQVGHGGTGHCEAVRVVYDPARVTYDALLDVFWRSIDPTDAGGQFADRGDTYRPAIFVADDNERAAAEASRAALAASGRFSAPIVVPVEEVSPFYVAEDYHQDYYRTNPAHYRAYRRGSGREGFLSRHWPDAH